MSFSPLFSLRPARRGLLPVFPALLGAIVASVLATAGEAHATGPRSDAADPDLALSAAFAPPRYVVRDPAVRERLRTLLQERHEERHEEQHEERQNAGTGREGGDALESFSLEGNTLRISHRLARRLAAEEAGRDGGTLARRGEDANDDPRALRRAARRELERLAGLAKAGPEGSTALEEDVPAFPASYRPDDLGLQDTPQWGLRNDGSLAGSRAGVDLNMGPVWERFDGSDTLVIAVLDAGFNFHHPDLQGRSYENPGETGSTQPGDPCWTGTPRDKRDNDCDDDDNGFADDWRGWDFVQGDNDPQDYHSHGTQTGGLIAATFDNGTGIAGMLPRVRILPVRVLSTAGFGSTADIAAGVRYAAAMRAHVINFSIGVGSPALGEAPCSSSALCSAFAAARDSGVIIAAAAANDGKNLDPAPTQPSSYGFDNVYMVASHLPDGSLAGHSNYGAATVDIAAPGLNIVTTTIPPPVEILREDFEAYDPARWEFSGGGFAVVDDTLEGAKSLAWTSGSEATAVWRDTLMLRGKRGGLLRFRLTFQPAHSQDGIFIDARRKGASSWFEIGGYTSAVAGKSVAVNLTNLDDTLVNIRVQTCSFRQSGFRQNDCLGSTAGRVLRIDDLRVTHADETPSHQARYEATGGTSVAAPYFAGYAGLMRLATDRAGVPLTRERMLAGAAPEPALAGKLITGGRLDAARGLDFYLRTLPRLVVSDSAAVAWDPGAAVAYAVSVADSAGEPRDDFVLGAVSMPPGGNFSPAGMFTWNTGGAPEALYDLRVKAESGPVTLRALVTFSVGTPAGVSPAAPGAPVRLLIGGRAFLVPAAAFSGREHRLRVELYGADGRTLRTVTGTLTLPTGARSAAYRLNGPAGVGARAWLDGTALRPAPRD